MKDWSSSLGERQKRALVRYTRSNDDTGASHGVSTAIPRGTERSGIW